jgi:hypothetical protein
MSLNNKYGKCCKCPARVNLARELTEYRSASIYNQEDRVKSGAKNLYEYNRFLETNGKDILREKQQSLRDNNICKDNGDNIFFIDSTDFHARFNEINDNIPEQVVVPSDSNLLTMLSTDERSNYTLRAITSDRAMVKSSAVP